MEKEAFSQQQLINNLIKIAHSDKKVKTEEAKINNLNEIFTNIGLQVVNTDPNLFAHFLAWNHINGKINDSKVAYPIIALRGDPQFAENAICHLISLGPRELIRAYRFSKKLVNDGHKIKGRKRKTFQWAIQKYLDIRQSDKKWFDKCVMQHKKAMKSLYAISHKKPSIYADNILFKNDYPKSSVFDIIRNLKKMPPKEAAGNIIHHKIPLTVAMGAVSNIKNEDVQLALIEGMSGNELLNNTKMFERLGVMERPALKASFNNAIERAKKDKKVNIYKASRAKDHVSDNVAKKLVDIQKVQEKKQKGIEGDWLIHGDISHSMYQSIDIAKKVAGLIASQIKGKVYLIFANTSPVFYDVTGMSYDEICQKTKFITAYGGTSIGCSLDYLLKRDLIVNGIVLVSDGGENNYPVFWEVYDKYIKRFAIEPNVYHLRVGGDHDRLNSSYIQKIDCSKNFDEYTFPNLINILKANKYKLLDEIMEASLLTFDKVFK